MITTTAIRRWVKRGVVGGVTAAMLGEGLLANAQEAIAPPSAPASNPPAVQASHSTPLSLADCIRMAMEQQPALGAYRASLAAAETNRRGVEKLPTLMSRTLPVRRKQSELAVTIASEQVKQQEDETAYTVTRLYYTVLFAQAQKKVTDKVVEELAKAAEAVDAAIKNGEAKETDRQRLVAYRRLAESRQEKARVGELRANAALREAIGGCMDPCCPLPLIGELPDVQLQACCKDVVELALCRRHEIVQTMSLAEIFRLEVDAQGMSYLPREYTFAMGGDLHSRPVPQGSLSKDYVPAAVGPEMPAMMFGCRKDRVARAEDFFARMTAVVDKTRNLLTLEAEDAFLRWQEASTRVGQTSEAATKSKELAGEMLRQFKSNAGKYFKDYLESVVLEAQATAAWNEAKLNRVVAAANLARVTGGGICLQSALQPKP